MKLKLTMTALLMSASIFAKPTADIAILLDTSGSMQRLINQVRDGLWQTLNELGEIRKDGEVADLRLALYEYGSGVVSAEANFIQMLAPLTTDHTVIAEKLFATKAQGSEEFSGKAIQMATEDLSFSLDSQDYKAIVIAGNETIHQGPVDALDAAAESQSKDILINSIFAGAQTIVTRPAPTPGNGGCRFFCPLPPAPTPPTDPQTSLNPIFSEWMALAEVGGGKSLNIDHKNSIPYIPSPFDDKIVESTEAISTTYLPFGSKGQEEYNRMRNLDRSVRNSGNGSYMGWGDYRSGNFGQATYATWDLVSAHRAGSMDLTQIVDSELPKVMRGLTLIEKRNHVIKISLKRKALEDEINNLREKRKVYVDAQLASDDQNREANFADAMKEILLEQLRNKGFVVQN